MKITLDTYCHQMPGGKKSEVDELDSSAEPERNISETENADEDKSKTG